MYEITLATDNVNALTLSTETNDKVVIEITLDGVNFYPIGSESRENLLKQFEPFLGKKVNLVTKENHGPRKRSLGWVMPALTPTTLPFILFKESPSNLSKSH